MPCEIRFQNEVMFAHAVKTIASIPRTPLSAADYLSHLRQKGEATCEQRIQFLLNQPDWEPAVDLFSLQGGLIQPYRGIMRNAKGERCDWNKESLFQAYLREELSFESPGNRLTAAEVTNMVRASLHQLSAYAGRGCNALVYYKNEPIKTNFYTTSIPIKIYKSGLTLVRPNDVKLRRVK